MVGEFPQNINESIKNNDEIINKKFQEIFDISNPKIYEKHKNVRSQLENIIKVSQENESTIRKKINKRKLYSKEAFHHWSKSRNCK
jgi:hypothetical protein